MVVVVVVIVGVVASRVHAFPAATGRAVAICACKPLPSVKALYVQVAVLPSGMILASGAIHIFVDDVLVFV